MIETADVSDPPLDVIQPTFAKHLVERPQVLQRLG
jgi:hypothetical protein